MTGAFDNSVTTIRRLTLRCSPPDPLSTRFRASSMLRTLSLRAHCLPPSAILCVRRLRDPRPGILRIDGPSVLPAPDWEAAIEQSLADISRHAVRVAFEPFREDAPAIWFLDESELLAALALDWMDQSVWRKWWWPALFGSVDWSVKIRELWVEYARAVPAALQTLSAAGKAADFVSSLGEDESRVILAAVLTAHQLQLPIPDAHAAPVPSPPELSPNFYPRPVPRAPWSRSVPEAGAPGLPPVSCMLLG